MSFYKNVKWVLGGTIGIHFINILVNIILARILTPEIFGLVGIASVFIGFIYIVQEAGISSAIVQKTHVSRELLATTFYFNILLSIFIVIVTAFFSSIIADLYSNEKIAHLLNFSIIGMLGGALGITHRAILTRDRNFKAITRIDFISEVFSSIGAICFAIWGDPFIAVGFRIMFRPALQTILLVANTKLSLYNIRPSFQYIRDMLPFSLNVLGVKILNYVRNNVDYLMIGMLLGSYSLGIYTMAFQWSTVARFSLSQSVARVAFPEISRNQNDILKVKNIYLNMVGKLAFFTFPVTIGLALVANEFILIFYGEKWGEAVPILQILMIAGMVSALGTLVGSVFNGLGKPHIELQLNIISFCSFVLLVYIASFFGLLGVAVAVLINTLLFDIISTGRALKLLKSGYRDILNVIQPALISTSIMAVLVLILRYELLSSIDIVAKFLITIISGIITYLISTYFFNKGMLFWLLKKLRLRKILNILN